MYESNMSGGYPTNDRDSSVPAAQDGSSPDGNGGFWFELASGNESGGLPQMNPPGTGSGPVHRGRVSNGRGARPGKEWEYRGGWNSH